MRLQKLNPRVAVHVDTGDIRSKAPEFFSRFTVIIATGQDLSTLVRINEHARRWVRPFYAADSHGFYGFIFSDLIEHEYVIERERSNIATRLGPETATQAVVGVSTKKDNNGKTIEMVTKRERYCALSQAAVAPLPAGYAGNRRRLRQVPPLLSVIRALWSFQSSSFSPTSPSSEAVAVVVPAQNSHADLELFTRLATEAHAKLGLPPETLTSEFLATLMPNIRSELAPVTAFLGGQLAQDVINVLGQREQPLQNFLLFDALESKAPVFALHPMKDEEKKEEEGKEGKERMDGTGEGSVANGTHGREQMLVE